VESPQKPLFTSPVESLDILLCSIIIRKPIERLKKLNTSSFEILSPFIIVFVMIIIVTIIILIIFVGINLYFYSSLCSRRKRGRGARTREKNGGLGRGPSSLAPRPPFFSSVLVSRPLPRLRLLRRLFLLKQTDQQTKKGVSF